MDDSDEVSVAFDARICILGTDGQTLERKRVVIDQNFKRDLTKSIMDLTLRAIHMQQLARRAECQKYFVHVEIPESEQLEDEVNQWINVIANSQLRNF